MSFTLRSIGPADPESINALHRSVGWPERSEASWRWLLDNPARRESGADAGWLIESDRGEPCGFTGNFVQRFCRGDEILYGATGFSIIVRPEAQGQSRTLLRAFTAQPGMFALYVFNANPASSPLYRRHDMVAWPPTTHDLKLSWRVDPVTCAVGRFWREVDRRAPRLIDRSQERLMNPRLAATARLDLPEAVTELTDLGDGSPYADFWTALKREGRLIADRSPAALRWRLADPDLTLRPLILVFRRGTAITGYAMAMVAKNNLIEPPVLEIIDLVALRDEPAAIEVLAETLLVNAQRLGAAKMRIQTVNEDLVRRLGPLAFSARHEGGWGHCHVRFATGPGGHHDWTPTPFDGDYGLSLRPVPIAVAGREAA
jgi:hypothetical protein